MRATAGTNPTDFQLDVRRRARAAAEWLVRSIDACDGAGSAAYYSRMYRPLTGWAPAYPETTGYIIPTLIDYAAYSGEKRYADIALQQADWVRSLQFDDGALPGGFAEKGRRSTPSIFNTGQMILGLVAAADHSGHPEYLESASRAARWLAGEVDPDAGTWTRHAYKGGFSPAYYTRVAWPMLEVWHRTRDEPLRAAAVRVLDTIASWQQPNGAVKNWAFDANSPAFTHTIAYTLRGFWESGRLLSSEAYLGAAHRGADALRRSLERRGRLAGAYDMELNGRWWYTCLTGNCQMALVWMRCADSLSDVRFVSAAFKALLYAMSKQRVAGGSAGTRGAIAGSSPYWGRYLTLRHPNWATKFLLDALMEADARVRHIARGVS